MKELKDGWLEYETEEEVTSRAKEAINVPFCAYKDYKKYIKDNAGKGNLGNLVQEKWFKVPENNNPEPDFPIPGIELKVTGYTRNAANIIKAKERLVFNMLNYNEECGKDFYNSSFMKKNQNLELMLYEYHKDIINYPISSWFISHTNLLKFNQLPEVDKKIIIDDYNIINKKIQDGKAHEISEGDTMYLAACTKSSDSSARRTQPKSDIKAKPRAYSFKPSYMTTIINDYIINNQSNSESLINDISEIQNKTFDEVIYDKIRQYIGKSVDELKNIFQIDSTSKSINALLVAKMLKIKGNINQADEIRKADITVKTIHLNKKGTPHEDMSFPTFHPFDFDNALWENSDFYDDITHRFLFVIFKDDSNGISHFSGIKFWTMPYDDLIEAQKVWEQTKEIFTTNTLIVTKNKQGKNTNNLPKSKNNRVCHVRPHTRNAATTVITHNGIEITKQCFFLNKSYIRDILK